MDKPLVSIVTPCYNGEKYLGRFLNSVLNQTYTNIELILINDGSTDRTDTVIEQYKPLFCEKNIRFIAEYQQNAGQAAALNKGLKLFGGEYITCVDSDDELMPEYIEKKVEFLQQNPEYVYCYGKAVEANEDRPDEIVRIYEKRNSTGRYSFFEDILYVNGVFFSGYFFKTDVFDKAIPGREIYTGPGGQNAQLLLPFSWYYGQPGYVGDSVYKYYVHSDSHSHSINASEKIIRQLYNYENILVATLEKIDDKSVSSYIDKVKIYYARLRFGNAVDTQNASLIKKHYNELKNVKGQSLRDFLLYLKYSNILIRKLFGIK